MRGTATTGPETLRCSFCAKSRNDVDKLIAGPGVYICNECVVLCDQILADELGKKDPAGGSEGRSASALQVWKGLSDDELLAEMVRAHGAHANVDRAVAHHVALLRARGVTWARIGGALGTTRQSAWERFSGEE